MKINKSNSRTYIVILIIAVCAALALGYFLWKRSHVVPAKTPISDGSVVTSDPNVPKATTPSSANDTTSMSKDQASAPSTPTNPSLANTTPTTPSGAFISNHRLSLSATGPAAVEGSVCNTSPNTECWIIFTKDGVEKQLARKNSGAGGSVSWEWTASDVGLTIGKWSVTTVAHTNGGESKSNDAVGLEVIN